MKWLLVQLNRIKAWWSKNNKQVKQKLRHGVRRFWRVFDRISRNIIRIIIIGVILNVVAIYLYPAFPERFPAIYGWYDGWIQLGEFAVKAIFKGAYSLFNGNWGEFWTEYNEAFDELLQQFTNWLNALHF